MNVLGIYYPQREWFKARLGFMMTSSKVSAAITKRQKGGTHDLAARRNLKMQMISEELTGETTEHYVSPAMDWGIATEPKARDEYDYRTGRSVEQLGIVLHPTNPRAAATADGWVAPNGILEIKCPETYTHLECLASGHIPPEYLDQINWQMACCGPEIEWCDFVSFDPRITESPELQMLIIRHERDEKRIAEMEALVDEYFLEVLALFEQIKRGAGQTLESKLRQSIRQAEAKKAFNKLQENELRREMASVESGLIP